MKKIERFLDLAKYILEFKQQPLSEEEIWTVAEQLIKNNEISFSTSGKTPWQSIGARIYMDIKNNPATTEFVKLVKPKRFALRKYVDLQDDDTTNVILTPPSISNLASERDLHKYLTLWLAKEKDVYTKTIFHESSLKNKVKNGEIKNQWLYPDMIGVEFLTPQASEIIVQLRNNLATPLVKLYSYELKKTLTPGTVRECYFQAVSNSSWANEGYLVFEANNSLEPSILDELQRLNNAFGIGVIQLATGNNVFKTEVLFFSRIKDNIDIESLSHVADKNSNVKVFIKTVNDIIAIKKQKDPENQELLIKALTGQHFDKIDESLIDAEG